MLKNVCVFRSNSNYCVRLPRTQESEENLKQEFFCLPTLAAKLPLTIPSIIHQDYPNKTNVSHWAIYRWIDGENAFLTPLSDYHQAAKTLAHFLKILQTIDTEKAKLSYRGGSLKVRDQEVLSALVLLHGTLDTSKAKQIWEQCLQAPEWDKAPVWVHGDLLPANILVNYGKIHAVIDWGLSGIGDSTCDLIVAWSLLPSSARETFRQHLAVNDATWLRGCGWALSIGLIIMPYYKKRDRALYTVGHRMVQAILHDFY